VAEVAWPVAELVMAVAAEVTALVAEVAADVTGATVGVLVLVAAEVPELELVVVPVAVVELVVVPVTAEVTEPVADVTEPVAEVSGPVAEVSGPVAAGGAVAACAWRENASRATMIPAATIATCTARRAMSRTIGCGMSSSRTTGDRPDPARTTSYQRPETRGGPKFRLEPDICDPPRNVLFGHHRTAPARVGQGTPDTSVRANRELRSPEGKNPS
jgi:hypothetical protein